MAKKYGIAREPPITAGPLQPERDPQQLDSMDVVGIIWSGLITVLAGVSYFWGVVFGCTVDPFTGCTSAARGVWLRLLASTLVVAGVSAVAGMDKRNRGWLLWICLSSLHAIVAVYVWLNFDYSTGT
jgi:hypothetical protein